MTKGNMEGARIHAENAIREKSQAYDPSTRVCAPTASLSPAAVSADADACLLTAQASQLVNSSTCPRRAFDVGPCADLHCPICTQHRSAAFFHRDAFLGTGSTS